MAIIKFDSEKADALIRDLTRISSELDTNFNKVYNNTHGKEVSLTDPKLKVYGTRNKTIDVVQEDGSIVQEIVKEKYLKNDYVANARLYNKHVRNIYNRSTSARTKATKSIEEVINSLNKIKALISEYETEHSLRMSNSLDDAGQFDFNFLAAYGPMGRPQNYSHSFGTIVAEDAYTSLHLGMLGKRPTSINLEKLEVFDGMLEIARNNSLTAEEQMKQVHDLLMENVLEVSPEELAEKAKLAYESMKEIVESNEIIIDDTLRIESLVKLGIPVIEDYDGDLAIDITNVDGAMTMAAMIGKSFIDSMNQNAEEQSKDKEDAGPIGGVIANLAAVSGSAMGGFKAANDVMGIDSDVTLDAASGQVSLAPHATAGPKYGQEIKAAARGGETSSSNGFVKQKDTPPAPSPAPNDLPKVKEQQKPANNGPKDQGPAGNPQKEEIRNTPAPINNAKPAEGPKAEVIEKEVIEKPVLKEELQQSSEDIAIDREIQSVKIENNYKEIEVQESSESAKVDIEIDDNVERKGSAVLAGAAGIGALSKMGGNSNASMPQVNGMAAGELLGINTGSDAASMGMVVGNMPSSSVSTGTVNTPTSTSSTVGGESTSDRGALNNSDNANKSNSTSSSGRGGATLEDKENNKDENSYGKPNKPEENEDVTKKGLLGDASIAELDAKDEKEMKVATGVTAVTAVTSGALALFNVFPWLMLIIALIAIGSYVGYRVKKKKDKEKRLAALNAQKQQEAANATVTMEAVQNVSEITEETVESTTDTITEVQESVVENEVVVQEIQSSGDEFSEQPYEPSRDGMTEIGGQSTSSSK